MDNTALKKIAEIILKNDFNLVLIMGPGAIGKSFLSGQLVAILNEKQIKSVHIDLDGFMLEKSIRDEMGGISGYNPDGFEICLANEVLGNLITNSCPQTIKVYNKATSQRDKTISIQPASVYIIEGPITFYTDFINYSNVLKLFLTADKQVQLHNRIKREKAEIGYSEEQVKTRFNKYYADYLKYIKPKELLSDISVSVDNKHTGTFLKNNLKC